MRKKKTTIQITSIYGSLLFEHSSVDNTKKITIEKAVEEKAYLRSADLSGADLSGADLRSADLSGAKFDEPIYFSELYNLKLLRSTTKLVAWKYLTNGKSPYYNAEYGVGKIYTEKDCETDEFQECGKGLNAATLTWCLRESRGQDNIELIEVEFTVSDIVAIPYWTDGKFRVSKFKVLRKISRDKGIKLMEKVSGIKANIDKDKE